MRLDIVPGARISQVTDLLYPVSDINMETFGIIVDISKDCWLSVQKKSRISLYYNSFLTKSLIFAEIVAEANSNLGIVVCFKGVTRPFPTGHQQEFG